MAHAAEALLGVAFRFRGRSAVSGVDCVGLAALALRGAGWNGPVPDGYRWRGGRIDHFERWASDAGLMPAPFDRASLPGDLWLAAPVPGQFHLMIFGQGLIVHAHAGLGMVVGMPLPSPWPLVCAWRLPVQRGHMLQPTGA